MACSSLLCFAAVLLMLCARAAGEQEQLLRRATALSFVEGYTQLFGDSNLALHGGGKRVHISLDERTGAGFASRHAYLHGFFSARIKLPADHTAGVVVAFYMSNGDVYERTHDELDFEFLGNVRGREWRVQTNVYGNGSTAAGREERYGLWFDPTEDLHQYAIRWSSDRIVFYVGPRRRSGRCENGVHGRTVPVQAHVAVRPNHLGRLHWPTSGGPVYKVDYKYAPYVAEFTDLALRGCATTVDMPACPDGGGAPAMSLAQRVGDGGVSARVHDVRLTATTGSGTPRRCPSARRRGRPRRSSRPATPGRRRARRGGRRHRPARRRGLRTPDRLPLVLCRVSCDMMMYDYC
ncbi:hypothetical protein PR202_gb19168 [Eleusine coracana subsp. coracana]|uniref:GH16 domain-containing protein n=1 Tax=Eleusine coracana subsp. coracana TaxID=191504 RepID=A0AAV5F7B9_ELECO|nr:hypothetical protein PR202_gb19168 [Eleusine coracana subsp. coracana]